MSNIKSPKGNEQVETIEIIEEISKVNSVLGKANEIGSEIRIEAFGASNENLLSQIEEAQNELNNRMMGLMAAKNDLTSLKFIVQRLIDES